MAGIDIELGAPIRAGDSIHVSSELKETYEKTGRTGTMIFAVVRSTLTNQKGELVAYVDHRMMNRPQKALTANRCQSPRAFTESAGACPWSGAIAGSATLRPPRRAGRFCQSES